MELSRSEQKRRMKQLEQLVEELSALPESVIGQVPCPEEVRIMLREASGMKGGARKRQVKYVTKLLKGRSTDELYAFLGERKGAALQEKKDLHELEYYRDLLVNAAIRLLEEARQEGLDPEEELPPILVSEISKKFPGVDTKMLANLAWLFARTRNRKHGREIFRLLRAAMEQNRIFQE